MATGYNCLICKQKSKGIEKVKIFEATVDELIEPQTITVIILNSLNIRTLFDSVFFFFKIRLRPSASRSPLLK